jgi:hypothetical protein
MRFATLLLLASGSAAAFAASSATTPDPHMQGAYKFNEGGWTYVHLEMDICWRTRSKTT